MVLAIFSTFILYMVCFYDRNKSFSLEMFGINYHVHVDELGNLTNNI